MNLRIFGLSYAVTLVSLVVAFLYAGVTGLVLCAILGILEISLSFDNAVVNATVLERMSAFWQRIFLTIGVLIAVFGMRLVFPLLIVGITAQLSPVEAVRLALEQRPAERPHELRRAAQRRLPADRRVRRHVPADALPRLAVRGPRHPLAVLAGEAAGQDRPAVAAVDRDRARRAGRHVRDAGHRPQRRAHVGRAGPGHLPAGQRARRLLRPGRGHGRRRSGRARAQRLRPLRAGQGHRQGGLLPLPLPRGARRGVLVRRRDRRVRHHHRPDPHRAGPRPHRRHVRPLAHGLPGAQGHAGRLRLPRARRALGDRRAVGDPADRHRLPRQRVHHRPDRRRVHRRRRSCRA